MMVAEAPKSLPILKGGLCPSCIESIARQEEQYRQGNIYPSSGNNQHNTQRFYYLGVHWMPSDWAVINTLKRAAEKGLSITQAGLALAVYGRTRVDMRHAVRQRVYCIRKQLKAANAPFDIVNDGNGYQWVARNLP